MTIERPQEGEISVEPYNVELVHTPNGDVRLVYGIHPFDHPTPDLGNKVGGFAVELSGADGVTDLNMFEGWVHQIRNVLDTAAREGKPIFLTDIGEESSLAKFVYVAATAVAGVEVASWSSKTLKKKDEDPTRRNVLGKIASAGALTYLGTDILANALGILGDPKWEATRRVADAAQVMDPVSLHMVKLRNLTIADNLELLQARYPDELKKADLVGVYGMGHKALGEAIRMGHERRMEELRVILTHLTPPYGLSARGIATVARIQSVGNQRLWAATDTFLNEDMHRIALEAGLPAQRESN